jgi:transcriptional regulator with PAS, ATPase and Fis domain
MKNVMCKQAGLAKELQEISMYKSILEQILENAYEGVVVTDATGKIIMLNNAYANYLGIDVQAAIGKHVTEVIDNTRVHTVVQSGVPEFGKLQRIGSHKAVVTRLPILFNQEIVAGVGIVHYRELRDMKELLDKLNSLESELAQIKEEYAGRRATHYTIQDIVGESAPVLALKKQIRKAADSNSTVLILGENGTGKELVSHAIHYMSARSNQPFVRINCAAIPADILESELFGYVGGAFTGSNRSGKKGKIEMADGGTLFLDEIGDMSVPMQAKLLRFLQEKEIERLGENKVRQIDVRVLAATNQNLPEQIRNKQFREDLYYRLQVLQLDVPPLRERQSDILLLVDFFVEKFNRIFGKKVQSIAPEVAEIFSDYPWPGNIRQLENVMERAFNMVEAAEILPEHLPAYLGELLKPQETPAQEVAARSGLDANLANAKQNLERQQIMEMLKRTRGNKSEAARLMGITRTTLYQKLQKYKL